MLNKYSFNKLVFITANTFLIGVFYVLLNFELNLVYKALLFGVIFFCLHYNLNVLHQASHGLLSKNRLINDLFGNISAIFGGVAFPSFRGTHVVHHSAPSDPAKDPDFAITVNTSFFLIPFKIWYHDKYYWTKGLWRKFPAWQYFLDRLLQIGIVLGFYLSGNLWIWTYFWLVPTYLVGFFNGMFLFYFPHYTVAAERIWRKTTANQNFITNLTHALPLFFIDVSRYYHEKHHEKVQQNTNFYPLEWFLYNFIFLRKLETLDYTGEFVDMYEPKLIRND